MRGRQDPQMTMLAFIDLEERVPLDHPLRTIKRLADRGAGGAVADVRRMYAEDGRPSIPPERLLKASLLIALYSVRSERAFCEELEYNLLFRWFLDMDLMEPSFDPTTFTKNRERLLQARGRAAVLRRGGRARPHGAGLLSDEHFTVDGTLIEAAASLKSFKPKDGDRRRDDRRTIPATRRSTSTARSARTRPTRARPIPKRGCSRRGRARKPSSAFMGHALMENRHGLLVDFQVTQATGTAERDVVPKLLDEAKERRFHPEDAGRRQELRHPRLRRRHARATGHAARRPEHQRPAQRHRRADHPPPWLRRQPADPEAGRGDLRLDEDGRRLPTDALPRAGAHRPGRVPGRDRLQPRAPQSPRRVPPLQAAVA